MAMRGEFIGHGFVPGFGDCYVFQNVDDPKSLFIRSKKRDAERLVGRKSVQFRKPPPKRQPK